MRLARYLYVSVAALVGCMPCSGAPWTPAQLQSAVNAAIAQGVNSLIIPQGTYNFSSSNFLVANAVSLLIEGSTSTLLFAPGFGVNIWNCTATTLQNVAVRYDPPCFTQGVITAVGSSTIDVTIDAGFPSCSPAAGALPAWWFDAGEVKAIYFNASSRLHVRGQSPANVIAGFATAPAPGVCRVSLVNMASFPPSVGWLVSLSPRIYSTQYKIPDFYRGSTWSVLASTAVTTRNVSVFGGGNFAFAEWGSGGGHVYSGLTLARASDMHLLSSNLDAFHSFSVGAGPHIENSNFAFQGDDAMNWHTRSTLVLSVDTASSVAYLIDSGDIPSLDGNASNPLRAFADVCAGDALRVFAPQDAGGAFLGVLTAAAAPVMSTNATLIALAQAALATIRTVGINPAAVGVWVLPFTSAPSPLSALDIVQFDRRACAGGTLMGSNFVEAYDSCFRLQASNSIVMGNTYTHMPGGFSVVYDESWLEGSKGIQNVSITNNVFVDIGAPPYASSIDQVINHDSDIVNLIIAGNTVLQQPGL